MLDGGLGVFDPEESARHCAWQTDMIREWQHRDFIQLFNNALLNDTVTSEMSEISRRLLAQDPHVDKLIERFLYATIVAPRITTEVHTVAFMTEMNRLEGLGKITAAMLAPPDPE